MGYHPTHREKQKKGGGERQNTLVHAPRKELHEEKKFQSKLGEKGKKTF